MHHLTLSTLLQAVQLAELAGGGLARLAHRAATAALEIGAGSASDSLQGRLRQVAAAVLALFPEPEQASPTPAQLLQLLSEEALPRAQPLAAVLQEYWALPAQAEPSRLELGLALASRPACANLRCPNVEAVAGGERGKRCGGCLAVRWCSAACAKAGWRAATGPHKAACHLLASAAAGAAAGGEADE